MNFLKQTDHKNCAVVARFSPYLTPTLISCLEFGKSWLQYVPQNKHLLMVQMVKMITKHDFMKSSCIFFFFFTMTSVILNIEQHSVALPTHWFVKKRSGCVGFSFTISLPAKCQISQDIHFIPPFFTLLSLWEKPLIYLFLQLGIVLFELVCVLLPSHTKYLNFFF